MFWILFQDHDFCSESILKPMYEQSNGKPYLINSFDDTFKGMITVDLTV